jgi:hypothetical protein
MRNKLVAWTVAAALMLAPVAAHAHAEWGGCLAGPMPNDLLSRCEVSGAPALAMAAIAAPIVAAGAVYTIVDELNHRHVETNPGDAQTAARTTPGQPPQLTLLPATYDKYRDDGSPKRTVKPNPALQFNETAVTVATAVTGVAVAAAIIATMAKK